MAVGRSVNVSPSVEICHWNVIPGAISVPPVTEITGGAVPEHISRTAGVIVPPNIGGAIVIETTLL